MTSITKKMVVEQLNLTKPGNHRTGSRSEITGHDRRRATEEGEWGTAHPPIAEWDELRKATRVLLRQDRHPRVFAAVLENPRMTEGLLVPVLKSEATPSEILDLVAQNGRWGSRYTLRMALCRNRRTRMQTALGLLPGLKKADLRALTKEPKLAPAVKDRARLLLGESGQR